MQRDASPSETPGPQSTARVISGRPSLGPGFKISANVTAVPPARKRPSLREDLETSKTRSSAALLSQVCEPEGLQKNQRHVCIIVPRPRPSRPQVQGQRKAVGKCHQEPRRAAGTICCAGCSKRSSTRSEAEAGPCTTLKHANIFAVIAMPRLIRLTVVLQPCCVV